MAVEVVIGRTAANHPLKRRLNSLIYRRRLDRYVFIYDKIVRFNTVKETCV